MGRGLGIIKSKLLIVTSVQGRRCTADVPCAGAPDEVSRWKVTAGARVKCQLLIKQRRSDQSSRPAAVFKTMFTLASQESAEITNMGPGGRLRKITALIVVLGVLKVKTFLYFLKYFN